MKKTGKKIPINWAKKIAEDLGYSQVIIHGYDGETGIQHVTTFGKSLDDCKNAANGGNTIKKLLKWPEELCDAQPKRLTKSEINIIPVLTGKSAKRFLDRIKENEKKRIPEDELKRMYENYYKILKNSELK